MSLNRRSRPCARVYRAFRLGRERFSDPGRPRSDLALFCLQGREYVPLTRGQVQQVGHPVDEVGLQVVFDLWMACYFPEPHGRVTFGVSAPNSCTRTICSTADAPSRAVHLELAALRTGRLLPCG